jgi:hypothetical protein
VAAGERRRVDGDAVDERGVALEDRAPLPLLNPERHRGRAAGVADDDTALGVDQARE